MDAEPDEPPENSYAAVRAVFLKYDFKASRKEHLRFCKSNGERGQHIDFCATLCLHHEVDGAEDKLIAVFSTLLQCSQLYGCVQYVEDLSTVPVLNYFGAVNNHTGALVLGAENSGDSVILNPAVSVAIVPKSYITYIQGAVGIGTTNPLIGYSMDMRGGIMTQGVTIADKDTYGASNYQTGIYAPSAVTGGSIQTSLTGSPDKFNQNFSIQMAPGSTTTIGTNAPYSSETALTITKSSTSNPLVAITQSNSTWNNNPALYITGVLTANGTIYCLKSSSTAVPGLGILGGLGDRLVLSQGSATVYPFSMGVTGISQWYSTPTGATHNFYINGINNTTISYNSYQQQQITFHVFLVLCCHQEQEHLVTGI